MSDADLLRADAADKACNLRYLQEMRRRVAVGDRAGAKLYLYAHILGEQQRLHCKALWLPGLLARAGR